MAQTQKLTSNEIQIIYRADCKTSICFIGQIKFSPALKDEIMQSHFVKKIIIANIWYGNDWWEKKHLLSLCTQSHNTHVDVFTPLSHHFLGWMIQIWMCHTSVRCINSNSYLQPNSNLSSCESERSAVTLVIYKEALVQILMNDQAVTLVIDKRA